MAKIEESISEDGQKIEITKNIKAEQRRYGSDKGISSRVEGVFGSQFPIDENVEVDLGVLQKILKLYLSARMATHCVILLAAIVNMFDAVSDYSLVYYLSATGFRYAGLIILLIDYGIFFITLVHYNMMFHQTEKRLKLIFISVFLTIFQPFTPAISALSWYIARSQRLKQETQDKLHYLTKTTTTIQGCAEAPAQIVASSWMVLTDQLEVPWKESSLICDNLGNCLHLGVVIPVSSFVISWISLVKASLDAFQTTDIISTVGLLFPNLLFRLGCSILLVTFLQFWSIGIFIVLFLVNITITCCYSAKQIKKQGVFKSGINLLTTMLVSIFTFNILPADPTAKERKGKADVDPKHVKKLATAIVTGGSTVMLLAMFMVYTMLGNNLKTDFNIILTTEQFNYSFFYILLPLYFVSLIGTTAFFFTFNKKCSTLKKLTINGIPLILTIGTIVWSIYSFPLGTSRIHIAVQTKIGDVNQIEMFTGVTGGALVRNLDCLDIKNKNHQKSLKCGEFDIDLQEKDSRTLNFTKQNTIFLVKSFHHNRKRKENIKNLEEKINQKYEKVFLIKSLSKFDNPTNMCLKCNNPKDNFCKRKVHEAVKQEAYKICSDSVQTPSRNSDSAWRNQGENEDQPPNGVYTDQIVEGNVMLLIGGMATVFRTHREQHIYTDIEQHTYTIEQHTYTDIEVLGISSKSCKGIPETFPLAFRFSEVAWDLDDEYKYTNGFYDNGSIILCKAMHCYKSAAKDWTEIPVDSSIAPVAHAATASLGRKHFIIGVSPENDLKNLTSNIPVVMLDSETDKFTSTKVEITYLKYSQYTNLKTGACAIGVENQSAILITGGSSSDNRYNAFALFYKPWEEQLAPSLNTTRKLHGCARLELFGRDVIVIAGGEIEDKSEENYKSTGVILASVEYLDVKNFMGGWKSLESLNIGRTNHPSVGMVGKRLTVAGGSKKVDIDGIKDDEEDESLDSVEYYDEKERRWILNLHHLQKPRHDHITLTVPASLCF